MAVERRGAAWTKISCWIHLCEAASEDKLSLPVAW